MRRKKTTIIIAMCVAMIFMAVGYAAFSTKISINGTTAVTSSWRVEFSDIRTANLKGGANNRVTPSVSSTTATFSINLVQPGDEVTYEIDITNYGDIVAEVQGATYSATGSDAIYVEVDGVRTGTQLAACTDSTNCPTITMTLKIGYAPSVTSQPSETTKDIVITLDIAQYVASNPTADGELIPELENVTLVKRILRDNTIQSDVGINLNKASDSTNGIGLYYTSTNTQNGRPTYYFRGNVTNNYVNFANQIWRIVRINEDGSIRLIIQDSVMGSNPYNTDYTQNAYVGYMYGTTSSGATYEQTHKNTNNSQIKGIIDYWYQEHLSSYYSYLADAGFCNDRSLAAVNYLGTGTNFTHYSAINRESGGVQFKCQNEANDLFTTSNSNKGNKALNHPIGLITMDEVIYASGPYNFSTNDSTSYLYNGTSFWTMTPRQLKSNDGARVYYVDKNYLYEDLVNSSKAVRPVINLKDTVLYSSGNGSSSSPYTVKLS